MSFTIGSPQQTGADAILSQLGAGIGSGVQQGIQQRLESFQKQKGRTNSATKIVEELGVSEEQKGPLIQMLSQFDAEKQPSALKNIYESQLLQQGLQQMMGDVQGPRQGQQPSMQRGREETSQQGQEVLKENVDEIQGDGEKITIGDVTWDKADLPEKSKQFPAFGPLADQAKLQQKQNMFNQTQNMKYSEGYDDLTKMRRNVENVNEAIEIIQNENLGGKARQFIKAIATQKNPNLEELIKTEAENKLYHLLYDFIRPKELGGSNPSTREVIMSLARLPSGAKGKEVSEFIANEMKRFAESQLQKAERINSLLEYDPYMNHGKFRTLSEKSVNAKQDAKNENQTFKEGQTATDASSGKQLIFKNGKWRPLS